MPLSCFAQIQNAECEDTCTHIHGIDVSHYQKDIAWEIVGQNSHMAYVYIKATEGAEYVDDKYERNLELAKAYGLKVGAYHFYRPNVPPEVQLRNFTAVCKGKDQDLLPMIDVEVRPTMSVTVFCDSLLRFLELVEAHYKQKPLVYTGTNFYNNYLLGKLNDYKLMIAQYSAREPKLADGRDFTMWQYTGKGRIDGVKGYVDKSRFMGKHTMKEIRYKETRRSRRKHERVEQMKAHKEYTYF